jgi:hypothetical protein
MKTCEHKRHPAITGLIYIITGLALFLHILSHLLPVIILLHRPWLEHFLEHPIVTCIALLFIPLSIYHMWSDRKMHKTVHRLMIELQEKNENSYT